MQLVDLARAHGVVAQGAHGPSQWAAALEELLAELVVALGHQRSIGLAAGLEIGDLCVLLFLGREDGGVDCRAGLGLEAFLGAVQRVGGGDGLVLVLDDGVVGDDGLAGLEGVGGGSALEEGGAEDEHPALDGVVSLQDLGVDVGNEEERGEKHDSSTGAHGHGRDVPSGLLVEAEVRRTLVDDGHGADGTRNQEEERRGVDRPLGRVLAHVHDDLDEHEDGGSESSGDGRRHPETSEDGAETLAAVPAPLNLGGTDGGDTHTSNGGDQRVCRGDVGGVARAPHDPEGSSRERTGEGEHLHAGVVLEGGVGDDAVLDGFGGAGADGDGTEHLEDGAEDHGLSVGDGAGGDGGCPGVSHVVCVIGSVPLGL